MYIFLGHWPCHAGNTASLSSVKLSNDEASNPWMSDLLETSVVVDIKRISAAWSRLWWSMVCWSSLVCGMVLVPWCQEWYDPNSSDGFKMTAMVKMVGWHQDGYECVGKIWGMIWWRIWWSVDGMVWSSKKRSTWWRITPKVRLTDDSWPFPLMPHEMM